MDRKMIGQFIAMCRRDKELTQEQLAEVLGVTAKSVSKWENGHCLPDTSLYEPLCGLLGISINELFAGKRIDEGEYKTVADQNLLQMLKHRLYDFGDQGISFFEFDNALTHVAELVAVLKQFQSKEQAVDFLVGETNFCYDECANAYDFYVNLFTRREDV